MARASDIITHLDLNSEDIDDVRKLQFGDHIAVASKFVLLFSYFHHGIYLGRHQVADFGSPDQNKFQAKPRIVSLSEFQKDRKMVRIIYRRRDRLPRDETVALARSIVSEPAKFEQYNLLTNNCEHFATYCKTGKEVSHQVTEKLCKIILTPVDIAMDVKNAVDSGATSAKDIGKVVVQKVFERM